ncbi:glutathione S-transferase family protein [Novosphingobium sp. KCTC 2891]|uniref:glutathione S-transferase family protein n=1 Tax=Novosphingobium sp. KCTC 2891 TaxID=2989730 RepID=UPI0022225B8B|nr:glutathione S-transferase family protein [Novosphingobium sp. KCTC 2891]MCW1381643.1 glutathione S-transferase family protein [Novosphingobium sp. KCTC 2891]
MLIVHHLGLSQSDKVVWLCEELGLDYELRLYDRDPVTRLAPAEYKALHPAGTAPVIQDGDVTLAESGAVIEYILAKYGKGRLVAAPDAPNFADYLYWFHFAPGTMQAAMLVEIVLSIVGATDGAASALKARSENGFRMLEERLGQVPYLAGEEFTAADIMNLFTLTTGRLFVPRDFTDFPNIRAYVRRVMDRPACQRALAKADPGLTIPVD